MVQSEMLQTVPPANPDDLSADDGPEVSFEEAPAELIAERDGVDVTSYRLPPRPPILKHPIKAFFWCVRAGFGIVSLILLLAVIAAIPVVNFLALGYLLEVEGRVARTGKLRNAFLLLDVAPRFGSIVLGIWLWVIPLRLIATMRGDVAFLDPGGNAERFLNAFAPFIAVLIGTHVCLALARGGSLLHFFFIPQQLPEQKFIKVLLGVGAGVLVLVSLASPPHLVVAAGVVLVLPVLLSPVSAFLNARWLWNRLKNHDFMAYATAGVQDLLLRLRLRHHFWLGVRGFAGAFIWLVIPTSLFAAATPDSGGRGVLSFIGGVGLIVVFSWLPFLQARFAMTGRWGDMFDRHAIKQLYRKTPLTWFLATAAVYVLALPLYLPKVYLLPSDATWLVTIVFIVTIYPARVFTGWVVYRSTHRDTQPWFGWRWLSRTLTVPLLALYVFLLFFTPLIGEHGKRILFEHHALLLPVPF